jgi:hypothetical protein
MGVRRQHEITNVLAKTKKKSKTMREIRYWDRTRIHFSYPWIEKHNEVWNFHHVDQWHRCLVGREAITFINFTEVSEEHAASVFMRENYAFINPVGKVRYSCPCA